MRYQLIFFLIFCYSCNYFDKKKLDSETILKKELQAFKWDELDQYPTFETCQEGINFQRNKKCFETTINKHISKILNENETLLSVPSKDTLLLELLVSQSSKISIKSAKMSQFKDFKFHNLVDVLIKSFSDLPVLYPAVKRSQYVKSSFILPIILTQTNAK